MGGSLRRLSTTWERERMQPSRKQNLATSRRCYARALANLDDHAECRFWLGRANTFGEMARH